ncbi:MAG: hypothetical protein ACYDCQ_16380 [Dehalococcoidia bacterium]
MAIPAQGGAIRLLKLTCVAASAAAVVGLAIIAYAAAFSWAALTLAVVYGSFEFLCTIAIVRQPHSIWTTRLAIWATAITLWLVLVGIVSFGLLLLPAGLLWALVLIIRRRIPTLP